MKNAKTLPAQYLSPFALSGLPGDVPVAVALSGGADSVALLHMLLQERREGVEAIHVHHGIRGAEADRDAAFCEAYAKRLGVPCTVVRLDVPALAAARGVGLESAAREARYGAFSDFLEARGIPLLLTAHHADDQLETLLQHLLRGSGMRGLCGIPACRALGAAAVARPLLQMTKAQILAYCAENALEFVTDSTNSEPCCPRNRLRGEVLPILAELWPAGAERAAAAARALAQDEAYLSSLAEKFLEEEGAQPRVSALAALPRPIFVRVLQRMLPKPPEAVHVEAVLQLIARAQPHAALSLPDAQVCIERERLCVAAPGCRPAADYEIPLREGENPFPGGVAVLCGREDAPPRCAGADAPADCRIDFCAAAISGTLTLRPRRRGERILAGGQHKVLRKLPCMTRLSLEARACLPLLCDGEGVVAIPNGPVRDGVAERADRRLYLFFN